VSLLIFFSFNTVNVSAKDKLPQGVAAVVNGVNISQATVDDVVKGVTRNPLQKDTPQLRESITNNLITSEILVQEAGKLGVDKSPEAQKQLLQLRKNYLISLLMQDFAKKNQVTDAEIKAEYDRQVKINNQTPQKEYKVSGILVKTEDEAKTVIARLKNESFDKVAKDKSLGNNKDKGGDMGWVNPNSLLPALGAAITKMGRGTSQAPVQSKLGWHILKVDDERLAKVLTLDESKPQIRALLMQQKQVAYVKKLKDLAKISQ
jgi:peptidyl-prolyl cis-trans isomerase C